MSRERIFNLPGVITGLIGVLALIQLAVELAPLSLGVWTITYFSFIPARVSFFIAPKAALEALADVDGDELAALLNTARFAWWTPLTYAFLHANWTHLGVNSLTLAAFGTPVARRLGAARFLLFFSITAIAGALAHLATHPFDLEPVVGASAAISGAMAAIARFAFARGGALGEPARGHADDKDDSRGPRKLAHLVEDQRAVLFLATWLLANIAFGVMAPAPGGAGVIAWEAHIGGFLAGLLLFGWFDPAGADKRR